MGKRIFQYPEVTELAEDDYIMIDSEADDTRCILASKIAPSLMSKTVTERKVYTASEDGVKGYSSVNVKVPFTNITDLEGDIVTFDDGEDFPLAGLKVSIEPIQEGSGDPSPTNIRPISGWSEANVSVCGKNLFNPSSLTEGKTINSDGSIDNQANRSATIEGIPIQPNSRYTISYAESIRHGVFYYDKDDNFISFLAWGNNPRAFLTPSNAYYVRFSFEDGTAPTNVMLSIGETAQPYTAYNGHTYTIPFTDAQGNPIEVFGGELDVVNGGGQPSPLKKVVYDGSNDEDWRHYGGNRVTVVVDDFTSPASGVTANIMCDKLKTITKSQQGGTEYVISGSDEGYHQFMVNVGISDIAELRTWLSNNPITVVYELATPSTFTSQPTSIKSLEGTNNVWADCGKSLVSYQKAWIQPDFTPDNN